MTIPVFTGIVRQCFQVIPACLEPFVTASKDFICSALTIQTNP
jgi:hypothetical protein